MTSRDDGRVRRSGKSLKLNDSEKRAIGYSRVMVRLIAYLLRYRGQVALAGVVMFAYGGSVVALPWIVKLVIDRHIAGESRDLSGLATLVGLFMIVALIQFATGYVHRRILVRVGQQMVYTMRSELFGKLQRLSMAFFDQNQTGKIMSRIQNDVEHIQELNIIFIMSVANTVAIVGIVAAMIAMDVPLALMTLAVVLVLIPTLALFQRLARGPYQRVRQTLAEVNSRIQEAITGVRVIQSLNRQETNIRFFDEVNRSHLAAGMIEARYWPGLFLSVEVLTGVTLALLVSVGGNMILQGSLEVGVVVAFALYVERLFDPVQQITNNFEQLQRAMVAGDRIFEILDLEVEASEGDGAAELPPIRGEVRYEAVDFHYAPEAPVLDRIDLHIMPGETVALVGPTGAGKTTIASLLLHFYDPVRGRVTLDGHDIRNVDQTSLARQVSVVLQEPYLFSGSVCENIRYNLTEATDEDVVRAAKTV